MVDYKFFKFMGVDAKKFKNHLEQMKREYKIDKFEENRERLISVEILKGTFDEIVEKVKGDNYREALMRTVCWLDNYEKDFDIARFMMVGSHLSKWKKVYLTVPFLPFEINKNGTNEYVSSWCDAYKRLFMGLKHLKRILILLQKLLAIKERQVEKPLENIL